MGEKLSSEHKKEKELNREMFRRSRILQSVRYLAHQGQPLRGHDDGANSNVMQLLIVQVF